MFFYALFNINAKNIALLFLEKCLKDITLNENQNTNTKKSKYKSNTMRLEFAFFS